MSGSDADVGIILNATDNASGTVDSATKQINQSFRTMNQQQNAMGRQFLTNNQSLYSFGRSMQSVGRITNQAISLFNSYNLMQIRMQQASDDAADAQEKLSEAIAEYGPNSQQAITAAEQVQKAQQAQQQADQQSKTQFVLMVASMVAQSGQLITTVIPRLLALSTTLQSSSFTNALNIASKGGIGTGTISGGGAIEGIGTALATGGAAATASVIGAGVGGALAGTPIAAQLNQLIPQAPANLLQPAADQFTEFIANSIQKTTGFNIMPGLNTLGSFLGAPQIGATTKSGGQTPTIMNYFTIAGQDAQDIANTIVQKIQGAASTFSGQTP